MGNTLPGLFENPVEFLPECLKERSRLLVRVLGVHETHGVLVCPIRRDVRSAPTNRTREEALYTAACFHKAGVRDGTLIKHSFLLVRA
jgi:hypothetical protein